MLFLFTIQEFVQVLVPRSCLTYFLNIKIFPVKILNPQKRAGKLIEEKAFTCLSNHPGNLNFICHFNSATAKRDLEGDKTKDPKTPLCFVCCSCKELLFVT